MKMSINRYFTYSLSGILKLIISTIRTKLFYKNAKIIRFPFDIRGKKYISLGTGFTTGFNCRLEAYPVNKQSIVLIFGSNVQMNDYVHITAMESVIIGNNVLMASKIYISDCTHGNYEGDILDSSPEEAPINRKYSTSPVIIGDNVWIGESVSILPGTSIGKGTIIGANSVVTKDIPEFVIAVGIPAKPIKRYNFEIKQWERI